MPKLTRDERMAREQARHDARQCELLRTANTHTDSDVRREALRIFDIMNSHPAYGHIKASRLPTPWMNDAHVDAMLGKHPPTGTVCRDINGEAWRYDNPYD